MIMNADVVEPVTLEKIVKLRSTNVNRIHVIVEEHVLIESKNIIVIAQLVGTDNIVQTTLTSVLLFNNHAKMVLLVSIWLMTILVNAHLITLVKIVRFLEICVRQIYVQKMVPQIVFLRQAWILNVFVWKIGRESFVILICRRFCLRRWSELIIVNQLIV